jgi:hypothetical protein
VSCVSIPRLAVLSCRVMRSLHVTQINNPSSWVHSTGTPHCRRAYVHCFGLAAKCYSRKLWRLVVTPPVPLPHFGPVDDIISCRSIEHHAPHAHSTQSDAARPSMLARSLLTASPTASKRYTARGDRGNTPGHRHPLLNPSPSPLLVGLAHSCTMVCFFAVAWPWSARCALARIDPPGAPLCVPSPLGVHARSMSA